MLKCHTLLTSSIAILLTAVFMFGTMIVAGQDRNARSVKGTRSPVLARNGMVSTSQPLATAAGLRILQQGGNAIDAAIAAAAVLNVVEPLMTGIGGDAFAIVYWKKTGELHGLNASGRAPYAMNLDYMKKKGYTAMPDSGVDAITVPGALDGWVSLMEKFGSMKLSDVLAPAIEYAENGFPVSEIIANQWQSEERRLARDEWAAKTYLTGGRAPRHGDIVFNKNLAATFRRVAASGRDAFYKGEIAEKIVKTIRDKGGVMTAKDLADHKSTWVKPVSVNYKGYDLYELPPNGQGMAALQMLNILEGFDLKALGHNSAEYLHLLVEAKKLAFADRARYIADPDFAKIPLERLLSKEYAAERRKLIDPDRAARQYRPGEAEQSDTIYLTVVDKDHNAVSFINSLFDAFGSGIVAGDTGICLHNRGAGFSLDPAVWNRVEPHKRPLHTIIPAFVMKDGKPYLSYGIMGGDNQPQAHVQVFLNLVEFGMNVQEAGEAARFRHTGGRLGLESGIGVEVRRLLTIKGHSLTTMVDRFGGYQGILIHPETGVLMGGSDPRKDGCAMGW
ncbi:MAG: gamma-glutamyltransferase [Blastocatellia bacterium]|nr:gamma-glutamyltransferase [Blastocatellia bacterium]